MEEHLEEDDTEKERARNELSVAAQRSCIEQSEILFELQPPQYQMALELRLFLPLLYVHIFNYARSYSTH